MHAEIKMIQNYFVLILQKKNKVGELTHFNFKTYNKTIVIK